ncbi:MAG: hypothetical protein HRT57_13625 [Crocinitomicaceae bacterium]|nr:hypothetical protein [Crocinitomicaceae bacterium]
MKGLVLLLFILFTSTCFASQDDTTAVVKDTVHSVKKAVILSAVIPGTGQIYNHIAMPKGKKKAFWKVPLIYAGLGASTYFLIYNQTEQKNYKEEYTLRQDSIVSPNYAQFTDAGILNLYNQHLDWRDLSILAVAAVYFIQLIDAGVEAHFVSFDISEDLSLKLEPTLLNYRAAGLKMSFNFR